MATLTITVTMVTEDELDDSMALLEHQIAEALGWIGDVETVDIALDEPSALDDELTEMFEHDDEGEQG